MTGQTPEQNPCGCAGTDTSNVAKTSKAARWSLICGIAGMLFCLLGLPAIILGIIGLVNIKKSNGTLVGSGKAIAGIILGGFVFMLMPVFIAAIAIPNLMISRIASNDMSDSAIPNVMIARGVAADDNNPLFTPLEQLVVSTKVDPVGGIENAALVPNYHPDLKRDSMPVTPFFIPGKITDTRVYASPINRMSVDRNANDDIEKTALDYLNKTITPADKRTIMKAEAEIIFSFNSRFAKYTLTAHQYHPKRNNTHGFSKIIILEKIDIDWKIIRAGQGSAFAGSSNTGH